MSCDTERLEQFTRIIERLSEAVEGDIAALNAGEFRALRTIEPEVQRLTLICAREAKGLEREFVESTPPVLRARFAASMRKLRELLKLHARLLTRVRNASEGMIRAIAAEAERQTAPRRTYSRIPATGARSASAMVFNTVV